MIPDCGADLNALMISFKQQRALSDRDFSLYLMQFGDDLLPALFHIDNLALRFMTPLRARAICASSLPTALSCTSDCPSQAPASVDESFLVQITQAAISSSKMAIWSRRVALDVQSGNLRVKLFYPLLQNRDVPLETFLPRDKLVLLIRNHFQDRRDF